MQDPSKQKPGMHYFSYLLNNLPKGRVRIVSGKLAKNGGQLYHKEKHKVGLEWINLGWKYRSTLKAVRF